MLKFNSYTFQGNAARILENLKLFGHYPDALSYILRAYLLETRRAIGYRPRKTVLQAFSRILWHHATNGTYTKRPSLKLSLEPYYRVHLGGQFDLTCIHVSFINQVLHTDHEVSTRLYQDRFILPIPGQPLLMSISNADENIIHLPEGAEWMPLINLPVLSIEKLQQ